MPERIEVLRNAMGVPGAQLMLASPLPPLTSRTSARRHPQWLSPARRSERLRRERCHLAPESIDMTCCDEVRRFFHRCRGVLSEVGPQRLIVDLEAVEHADTKLVATLVELHRLAAEASVRIEVLASSAVRDVLRLCRLERLIAQTQPS